MLGKIKFRKISVVVFLTALIWVWADLALDQEETFSGATLAMGMSRSNLWISFRGEPVVDINNIRLKGSVSNLSQAKKLITNDPDKLKFTLDAEQQGIITSGEHKQDVRDILRQSIWIKDLGLTVISCEPEVVDVNVVELEKKELTVRCLDQDGNIREPGTISPQKVSMFVPQDWFGNALTAYVELTRGDLEKARAEEIEKMPYIVLSTGQPRRSAATTVKIKMPPEEDLLRAYNVDNPTLGYSFSLNTMGKYIADVANKQDVTSIAIRATPAAKKAYEDLLFQVILEIADGDRDIEEGRVIKRKVIYPLPREFVEKGEIRLAQEPEEAEFILVPVSPENP